MSEATARQISIHLQSEDGIARISPDSRNGHVFRPFAQGERGGYTSTNETLYDYFINDVPDPDEALALDPSFLTRLHNHPDVVAAMRKRELSVAQMKWRVVASEFAEDQKVAQKIADCVACDFRQIPNFESYFLEAEYANLAGSVGHEWKWWREADGTERPFGFKPVHKSRFIFDRMGNMALKTRELPVWGAYLGVNPANPDWSRNIPAGKFTYHVYRRAPGAWERPQDEGYIYWGMGEDVALYYVVTFDMFVWRFELKWLEKYGLPPTNLYHQDNRPVGEVRAIAASIRGESIRTIPMGPLVQGMGESRHSTFYDVKTDEVPSPSFAAFESYYQHRTKNAIANILLGSAEEQDKSGSGAGGYADHVSRRDSGPMIFFGWDARNISNTLTHQLVGPMVERGPFAGVPKSYYPQFVLEPKEEKDQEQQVKILGETAKFVPVRKTDFYERAGIEEPTPEEIEGDMTVGGETPGIDPLDAMMQGPAAGAGPGGPPQAGGRFGAGSNGKGANGDSGSNGKPGGKPREPVGASSGGGRGGVANGG